MIDIADRFVTVAPTQQNALDIFKDEWSSAMPAATGFTTQPGHAGLFQDPRIVWMEQKLGSVRGSIVLELGPLEGGHTYMIEKMGAKSVLAIESNQRAYLKCLIIKEAFDLKVSRFLLGDFNHYLQATKEPVDIIVASGVLYHMTDPVALLESMARLSKNVMIWTHYYDEEAINKRPDLAHKFAAPQIIRKDHVVGRSSVQSYYDALEWAGFSGGTAPTSVWLEKKLILDLLELFGFREVFVEFDQPDHPNGPAFAVCAKR